MIYYFSLLLLQSPPYSMYKEGSRTVKSNDAFEGYTIDLIKSVAEVLGMRSIS